MSDISSGMPEPEKAVFGYLRYPLLGERRTEMVAALKARAESWGGGPLRDVYFETASPVATLWALVEGLDCHTGGHLVSAVTEYARAEGIDVRGVIHAGRVPPVRWRDLLAELDRLHGGWIVVPSLQDLDGLGEPRHVVLQRLASMDVQVAYLRGGTSNPETALRRTPALAVEGTEIGQFRISAFGLAIEIAKLSAQRYLNRAGLGYLVDAVTDLLGDLIGRRLEDTLVPGQTNELTIQLIRRPESLVVLVSETHDHVGEPISATAHAVCGPEGVSQARRYGGGTVTRLEVALTEAVDMRSATLVRRPA